MKHLGTKELDVIAADYFDCYLTLKKAFNAIFNPEIIC